MEAKTKIISKTEYIEKVDKMLENINDPIEVIGKAYF